MGSRTKKNGDTTSINGGGSGDGATVMTEEQAWAIAMTWRDDLQCRNAAEPCVLLETDPLNREPLGSGKSYEWVSFTFRRGHEPHTIACARAAAISWFWLSCCAGFSGHENPSFWKRVFCELQRPKGMVDGQGHHFVPIEWNDMEQEPVAITDVSITDTIRFFDPPENKKNKKQKIFPRIKLNAVNRTQDVASVAALFMGKPHKTNKSLLEAETAKLNAIYECLRGFLLPERLSRDEIEVALELSGGCSAGVEKTMMDVARVTKNTESTVSDLAFDGELPVPAFTFHSTIIPQCTLQDYVAITSTGIPPAKVEIGEVEISTKDTVYGGKQMAQTIRSLLGIALEREAKKERGALPPPAQVVRVNRQSIHGAICSALPFSPTITTLRLGAKFSDETDAETTTFSTGCVSAMDWAWLGYAIFHPASHATVWRNLEITIGPNMPPRAIQILQLMAQGNNLQSVEAYSHQLTSKTAPLPLPPATSTFYHMARVQDGTPLYATASLDTESLLLECHGDQNWVCLCVDDDDLDLDLDSQVGAWMRVVAPGIGFAYLQSSTSIVELVSYPCASIQPSLETLTVRIVQGSDQSVQATAIALVHAIGHNLTCLDLSEAWPFEAPELQYVLEACPSLKALDVSHNGSLWATADQEIDRLPRLERLRLTIRLNEFVFPSPHALKISLRNLSVLRLYSNGWYSNFDHREYILQWLHTQKRLQYVHYSGPIFRSQNEYTEAGRLRYEKGRLRTRQLMGGDDLLTADDWQCDGPLSLPCRVAFLSVVQQQEKRDATNLDPDHRQVAPLALGCINNRDIITQIFAFASSPLDRQIWIGA